MKANSKRKASSSAWGARLGLIRVGLGLMTRREARNMAGIVGLMMLAGIFESAVVALVLPLVYVLVDPTKFEATKVGRFLAESLGDHVFSGIFGYLAVVLVLLLMLAAALTALATYLSEKHSAECVSRFAHDLLTRTLAAPYLWLLQNNTAVMGRHFFEDVRTWRRNFIQGILSVVQSTIMIVAPSSVAIAIAPSSGLLALLIVALVCGLALFAIRRRLGDVSREVKASANATIKTLFQILTGMREVMVSGQADHFVSRFDRDFFKLNRNTLVMVMYGNAPVQIINLLGQVGFVATAAFLWWRDMSGAEIAAQLALIGIVVSRVVPAFGRLMSNLTMLLRAAPFVETLVQFREGIDLAHERFGRRDGEAPVPAVWNHLSLQNVYFRYPASGRDIIDNVSIELVRGKTYGFVGQSGAGKSTLVNILLGLIEPTAGSVKLDETPISEFSLIDWNRRIGYVPQDPMILDSSILDNIVFGQESDGALVSEALERASLTKFVATLPKNVEAATGERGRHLSGGQAQRVALARALFKRPDILILDEATSALDGITEAEVYGAIDAWENDVTTLIVSHRVASLRNCDRIFVLDQGRVVEAGTFGKLIESSSLFRALASEEKNEEQGVS